MMMNKITKAITVRPFYCHIGAFSIKITRFLKFFRKYSNPRKLILIRKTEFEYYL